MQVKLVQFLIDGQGSFVYILFFDRDILFCMVG